MSFTVKIYSRYHVVYEGRSDFAAIPTKSGEVGILENHARMYAKLDNGLIRLKREGEELAFTCTGGILETLPNEVRILVDSSENVEEIDAARAADAVRRAEEAMTQAREHHDSSEFARASALLRRSRLRVNAAKRKANFRIRFSKNDPLK